jgi:hypothetical protein
LNEAILDAAQPSSEPASERVAGGVAGLVAVVAAAGAAASAVEAMSALHQVAHRPWTFVIFLLITFGLQLASIEVYGHGTYSFAGTGMLATAFAFGPGPAMLVGLLMGVTNGVRRRAKAHRVAFDMAQWALAAGAAGLLYDVLGAPGASEPVRLASAFAAGAVFLAINAGLLSLAMGLSEETSALTIWRERLRWMTPYGLASGPLAAVLVLAFDKLGVAGLLAFGLPPAFMMLSARQYLDRTRTSVEEVRAANRELQSANALLEERNADLRKSHLETIAALSRSMEAKDFYTGGHTERVSEIAVALGARLGYAGAELDAIQIGALLHDIGKIGIPEGILQKPGPLDEDEWTLMKQHPLISEFILSGVNLQPIVLQIARHSHERIDGEGYPDRLAGDRIPLPARIVLVADAFDALTTDRPYRPARTSQAALAELRAHTGTQFCPVVMEAFERLYGSEPAILGVPDRLSIVA